jgi:hypothetical protein
MKICDRHRPRKMLSSDCVCLDGTAVPAERVIEALDAMKKDGTLEVNMLKYVA